MCLLIIDLIARLRQTSARSLRYLNLLKPYRQSKLPTVAKPAVALAKAGGR
jgi:hypothetical protein